MNTDALPDASPDAPLEPRRQTSRWKIVLIVVVAAMVASVITVWLTLTYLFPREFKPVKLSEREEQVLDDKLARLDPAQAPARPTPPRRGDDRQTDRDKPDAPLTPERYSETDASREIRFSERELNGLLARNTELANKLAIDLSKDMASAKLLIPLDPDLPVFGGKTLRVSAGLELKYDGQKPIVMLRGISIWGVPIPNAWLGGIKNVDLVQEFGDDRGFWKFFVDGVEVIRVEEGNLTIKLKE